MKVKEESEKVGLKLNIQRTKIITSSPITSWQIDGEIMESMRDFIFLGSKDHSSEWLQPQNQKTLVLCTKSYDQPRQHIEKQRRYFAYKGQYSESYGVSSSHVWMWELDHKEGWVLKNWCLWTVLLKTPESPWDCKENKPVHPKGDQPWVFIGRTDTEAKAPLL